MLSSILVFDQTDGFTDLLKDLFKSENDYQFKLVKSKDAAFTLTRDGNINLLIIHWDNTIEDSTNLLSLLRFNKKTRYIPILLITSEPNTKEFENALIHDSVDYITKPLDKNELYTRVNYSLDVYQSIKLKYQNKESIEKQSIQLNKFAFAALNTENSVLILDANGIIEWVNGGFKKLYEYNLEDYKLRFGANFFEHKHTKSIIDLLKTDRHKSYNVETRWVSKKGNIKWIQASVSPIIIDDNVITNYIIIETDITHLKEVEGELKVQNEDLMSLTENLDMANNMLEQQKHEIDEQKNLLETEIKKSDSLLLNILPQQTADELKTKGFAVPRHYNKVSVLFTDFKDFSKACENHSPVEIVNELDTYFSKYDEIITNFHLEKIKTIGDAYMCAGGLPIRNNSNPIDAVLAALEIQKFMNDLEQFKTAVKLPFRQGVKKDGIERSNEPTDRLPIWQIRLGIHTGEVVTGVVGKYKFAYDIWGDTVNIASRMQQNGMVGKVNISETTYNYIKPYFDCECRGKIEAKGIGLIDMYFVLGLKPEFALDDSKITPNEEFKLLLSEMY